MDRLDAQFAALADPVRRAILARLAQGDATVSELQRPLGISQPAVSRHLRLLEQAGLIEQSRAAQSRPRRLKPEGLQAARQWIDDLRNLWSDSFDGLEAYLADPAKGDTPMTDEPRFEITRWFAAPRARVWDAWTRPEPLAQWFGPKGSSGTILAFDLRPGGEWRGRMDTPAGGAMYSKFVFREVEPMSRLVWVHGFADAAGNRIRAPFAEHFPLEMLTTVQFTDEGSGTRVHLSWTPLNATPEEQAFFASMMGSMHGGWTGSLDQLEVFLGMG